MRRAVTSVCILLIGYASIAIASPATDRWPPEVEAFIHRAAKCGALSNVDKRKRADLACDKLVADRAALATRYRRNPKIMEDLNGHWVIKVERVLVTTTVHDSD